MTSPHGVPRRGFLAGTLAAGASGVLAGCTAEPAPPAAGPSTGRASTSASRAGSWAPHPRTVGGLSCVAVQAQQRLVLHTLGQDVQFWGGVTLEATLPGDAPGTFSATAADYRRWLGTMAELGVRIVRLTRLHPPAFYAELRAYNAAHATSPIYLVQGVAVPPLARDLLTAPRVTTATTQALRDASAAVHGDLVRPGRATAARPTGSWAADVSAWTVAWILGDGWPAATVVATDAAGSGQARHEGRYFSSTVQASATEHWLAARLDELAALEAARGVSVPLAVGNSPETDPFSHPTERIAAQRGPGIDTTHVFASPAWPGGTFAAYAAAPYAPDFLDRQPQYANEEDPYRAYLAALASHHGGTPLLVSSFGVSSSLGSGSNGPAERDQGPHSEQEALRIGADLLRLYAGLGLAGGMYAAWHDDWSATTWNTAPRTALVAPARRVLTHDPLTADQWMGLLAHDPVRSGPRTVHSAPQNGMQQVQIDHDESWLYLTMSFSGRVTSPIEIGFDLLTGPGLRLPGGSGEPVYDIAIRMVPTMSTAEVFVRAALDPARLDGLPAGWWPLPDVGGWNVVALTTSTAYVVPGTTTQVSPTFLKVGELVIGTWDPKDPNYDSRATWHLERPDAAKPATLIFRLPWSMLSFADPSARTVLDLDGFKAGLTPIRSMAMTIESSTPGSPVTVPLTWPVWNRVGSTERLKRGAEQLRDAFAQLERPGSPDGP
ncbi:hypothetical protein [Agilicoccus flavus]|uniref:hypothetical protein n=1 Tax=Agilicoccus flavus TaxID=2775968 RepID=UPI001CF70409|nr:hypothetical protein [Agilicoccus flavus]